MFISMKSPVCSARLALLVLATALATSHAAPKPAAVTPRHDPPDMPFRAAPTPAATRSIAIAVSTNLHVGFDTDLCRIHTVWRGRGLNLYGPQYSFAKSPFISTFDGEVLWTVPPFYPWVVGNIANLNSVGGGLPSPPTAPKFLKHEVFANRVCFHHERIVNQQEAYSCEEFYRLERVGGTDVVVRRFAVTGSHKQPLHYLAHAEDGSPVLIPGQPRAVMIQRKADTLLVVARGPVKWNASHQEVSYKVERFTEMGGEKGNPIETIQRREARLWLEIPVGRDIRFEIVSLVLPSVAKARELLAGGMNFEVADLPAPPRPPAKVFQSVPPARSSVAGNEFYRAENFPLPRETEMLVTGMDFLKDGNLAVATWLGDLFIIEGATGAVDRATYRRIARGLLEPMGLLVHGGDIFVAEKSALTRFPQPDRDAEVGVFYRDFAAWDYSGHYNAFVYGPARLKHDDLAVAIAGHAGRWNLKYMGWVLTNGATIPGSVIAASGLREPNGIGTFGPDRDLFVTDNQGNWIAACKLNHIQQGRFYGHPSSKPAPEAEYGKTTKFDPPAVWFPYKLVRSASGFVEIPDDRFGPFKGQLLVGDFQNAVVTRVFLEKVNGEYQGAVWPMFKGFLSGVNRLAFGPDGNLYVGGCQRTWAAVAPVEAALERVSFTGKIPFEIREARARPDGFDLHFTQPVDPATAGNPESYDVSQYTYRYHAKYGSPEIDHDGRENRATAITVAKAEVSPDRLSVRLRVQGWKAGYVTAVRGTDVKSSAGQTLWNPTFYYTLNQLPK